MSEIGKSLVFYLKYFPQMQRFYEEDPTLKDLKQHPERELIAKKIKEVGAAAGVEAANLLEACFGDVLARLNSANVVKLHSQRRTTNEKNWQLKIGVKPINQRKAGYPTREIGIYLDRDGLTPWVWSRGGLAVEEKIMRLLGSGVKCVSSNKLGWNGGSVGLGTIPVPWNSAKDFVLNADGVIDRTKKVCEAISPTFIRKFIKPLG
jgi:hypothetical protein